MKAIYPGTFDPMTVGHIDVAHRASRMFDSVTVGVAASTHKQPFFSLDQRVRMAETILADLPNVSVRAFSGLLVEFANEVGARVIVRGLRAISDFEFEVQVAGVNRHLSPELETIFIAASQDYTFLSSSIVREVARHDGDVSEFVHPVVLRAFDERRAEQTTGAG